MSSTHVRTETGTTTMPRRGRVLNVVVWALQVPLALQFAMGGFLKLSGSPEMVDMFTTIGAGHWFRFLVGALEIAGAIGLLIPRLAALATLGLVALLLGALMTNLFVLHAEPWLPLVLLLLSIVVAGARRNEIVAFTQAAIRRQAA
jgi:uncharacterized membrane protein YphA (DoxX/SURF4 family)